MYRIETKKDKIKIVRAVFEWVVVIAIAVTAINALKVNNVYQPYDINDASVVTGKDNGFLAVSYFGVDRQGTDTLISVEQLDEQLKALHDLGYVTISQQDILDYYQSGKVLPEKSLFLMFEDGRRDTALFANKLLEKYNYKATILSYADKFEEKDSKFLSPDDIADLEKDGYWEIGTNGYRLSYINTYDRYDRYLGQLTSDEFVRVNQYIGRDYNHYLMDYIRDEDRIPIETQEEMKSRITQDYKYMNQIYTEEFGVVPALYCLMHSNTGRYGNTDSVSAVNGENIQKLFKMNFNRDGFALNTRDISVYDLTRIQPQAYWQTNHLLMRVKDDLPDEEKKLISFVEGDTLKSSAWTLNKGASEFKNNSIILTSQPQGEGTLTLKNRSEKNLVFSADLLGNKIGTQTVYLRCDENMNSYICVSLQNNHLIVSEKNGESENQLVDYDLHDATPLDERTSIEEDKKDSLVAEYKMRGKFASSASDSMIFNATASKVNKENTVSVSDGGEEYVPEIQINELGNTKLKIELEDSILHVYINGNDVTGKVTTSVNNAGGIVLASSWGGWGYSQRNVADDVYDGIFQNVIIKSGDKTVYDNSLHGFDAVANSVGTAFNRVLNWFITNL